tara:strand:- start:288 stop:521 length:234 start_codon:yes stop_codon:yes gene_type:complete
MSYDTTTVPHKIDERHQLSLLLGKAFAMSYGFHQHSDQTTQLLDMYRESRRWVDNENPHEARYGAFDAYLATQDGNV